MKLIDSLVQILTSPFVSRRVTQSFTAELDSVTQRVAARMDRQRVSRQDAALDDVVKRATIKLAPEIGDVKAPTGMTSSEAVTRAVMRIAETQGATIDQIEKILSRGVSAQQTPDGTGRMQFKFPDMEGEIADLARRVAGSVTHESVSAMLPVIVREQSLAARRRRAESEDVGRSSPRIVIPPAIENIMRYLADLLPSSPKGGTFSESVDSVTNKLFRFIATGSDGVDVEGTRAGQSRQDVASGLRQSGLFPTFLRDVTPPAEKVSALENLMSRFANFMDVPQIDRATANEDLTDAIDRLFSATQRNTGALGSFRDLLTNVMQRLTKAGLQTAIRSARVVNRGIQRIIPARYRARLQQLGARLGTRVATRFGVNPAVAARFGAAVGPAGIAIAALSAGASVISSGASMAYKALSALAKQSLETTYRLAKYSGVLAVANAQLEVNRTLRDIKSASDISETGRERLRAQNRLEAAIRPWSDALTNIGNKVGTFGSNTTANALESDAAVFGALSASSIPGAIASWVLAANKNTDAIHEDIKERRKQAGGNLDNAPINQWHKQMLNDPFDPVRNAPRKPIGPLP